MAELLAEKTCGGPAKGHLDIAGVVPLFVGDRALGSTVRFAAKCSTSADRFLPVGARRAIGALVGPQPERRP